MPFSRIFEHSFSPSLAYFTRQQSHHLTGNQLSPPSKIKDSIFIMSRWLARSPEMDPDIWGSMPEELLERVLCFLPMKTVVSFRSTCKRFKSFIFSASFLSKLRSVSPSSSSPFSSFLVLFHPHFHHHFLLYDSVLATWRSSFVPLNTPSNSPSSPLLSSSCNGLLCFSLPTSSSFLICNLFSQSSKVIRFPGLSFSFEILSLVPEHNGFKIFAIQSGSSSNSAFIYDSTAQSWTRFQVQAPISSDHSHQEPVCLDGSLYITTSHPFSVVSIDLESGELGSPEAELPSELVFMRLVRDDGDKGKIYMVGGVGRDGISRSLKLWELEDGGGNWVEMETLPEMMYRKFMSVCYHNYEHVYCFWHQGMICVCCSTWPEILYYRVSRQTWHWLSKCPLLPEKWRCGFRWFSFVPKICVPV